MLASKLLCPSCAKVLKAPHAEDLPAKVKCPGCGSKFELDANGSIRPIAMVRPPRPSPATPVPQPAFADLERTAPAMTPMEIAPAPAAAAMTPMEIAPAPPATAALNVPLLLGVIAGSLLLLGTGITLAVIMFSGGSAERRDRDALVENDDDDVPPPSPGRRNTNVARPSLDTATPSQDKDDTSKPDPVVPIRPRPPVVVANPIVKPPEPRPPMKEPEKPQPAAPSPFKPLPAEDQKKVNAAIDKGIAFLKDCLDDRGRGGRDVVNTAIGPVSIQHLGATALAGLTLLACGVPADDPAVQKVIARVRKEGPVETNTYVLSLLILFLDQLDDGKDRPLIQKLAIRLVAGQTIRGGWPYACPNVSQADQERLLKLLEDKAPLNRADWTDRNRLRTRYRGIPVLTYKIGQKVSPAFPIDQVFNWNPAYDDNSTTQFAVLALWAAQKSGIPVDKSLGMAEMRFRGLQNADGSWGYNKALTNLWCDSMTCAALMGLAAGRGVSKLESPVEGKEPKARGLASDPQVLRGLAFLGKTVGKPGFKRFAEPTASGRNNRLFGSTAEEDIFLLWSLERMSVIYSLEKIDGKEWYPWAAKLLVDAQKRDGSWIELYGSAPNTCFALLVLKRVNVVKDLTSKLQKLELSTLKKEN
jgi:hypothetical protein